MDTEEKIVNLLANRLAIDFFVRCLRLPVGETVLGEAKKEAVRIIALIKEDGYVRLAKDQNLPRNRMSMASPLLYATAEEARQDILKAGFRKVELEAKE